MPKHGRADARIIAVALLARGTLTGEEINEQLMV